MYDYDIDFRRQIILNLFVENLFLKYKNISIEEAKLILDVNGKDYTKEEIAAAINELLIRRGCIVRDDFFGKEPVYKYIEDEYYHNSSYTKHYYSYTVDSSENTKFLLISDTHIGNLELENFKLLHNIYDYAIKDGVSNCFHLGDILDGQSSSEVDYTLAEEQLQKFAQNYPNPKEIRTYGLIGNHDEFIHGQFNWALLNRIEDLRCLTKYLNNFYVIPRSKWQISFSNIKINFSHRLYRNMIIQNQHVHDLTDFPFANMFYFKSRDVHDVLISGHLHKGFIYNNNYQGNNQLLLGVPSCTNININNVVAYIVSLNYDGEVVDNMEIKLLISDSNSNVKEGNTYFEFR